MSIRYKGIEHGVVSDAPFVGARISAIDCHNNCPGCFNQKLREMPYQEDTPEDIIQQIKERKINQGIIFGGLEWAEQPVELMKLIKVARQEQLQIMIYTHFNITTFLTIFYHLKGLDIYVKCGSYIKDEKSYYDSQHDVILAGKNQKIYNLKSL